MQTFYLRSLLLLLLLAGSLPTRATHILGAELTYSLDPVNPLKIRAQLVLYTDFSLTNADNASATVFFQSGQSVTADRSRRLRLPDWKYKNIYFFDYLFPAAGTYTMFFQEQNRAVGVVNITDSHNQAVCIATQVVIDPAGASNRLSAQFLTDPLHSVALGQTTHHHVGVYDLEGDSLAFELVPALRGLFTPVNGYVLPLFVQLNAWTGALTYSNPAVAGQYAFAVKVTEFRNKKPVGYVIRDFSVWVAPRAATFAQALTVTPAPGITITPQNHIFISPHQVLSLQARLEEALADSTRLEVYSDLASKTDKFEAAGSGGGGSRLANIRLEAAPALQRDAPYLILLRAVSQKKDKSYPLDSVHTQEKGFWVYVGSDIVSRAEKPGGSNHLAPYPNPANHYLIIPHAFVKSTHTLTVYDQTGKVVKAQTLVYSSQTILWRQHFFADGLYYYTISDREKVKQSGRFIFR